jgi:hypothetical protein
VFITVNNRLTRRSSAGFAGLQLYSSHSFMQPRV